MPARLLDRAAIAQRLSTGPNKAQRLLAQMGVLPIDVGEGKNKRLRWLESAVDAAILSMHEKAQPKAKKSCVRPGNSTLKQPLAQMSADSLYEFLAQDKAVQ